MTTGASNDLEKVTATANQMVMRFGMSSVSVPASSATTAAAVPRPRHGFRSRITRTRLPARSMTRSATSSRTHIRPPATSRRARRDDLERISEILLVRETIDAEQFVALLEGASEERGLPAGKRIGRRDATLGAGAGQHPPSGGRPRIRSLHRPPGYAGGMTDIRADQE